MSMASFRQFGLKGSVLDTNVHEFSPRVECAEDYSGNTPNRKQSVDIRLLVLGAANLAIVRIHDTNHRVPDWLHHVVIIERRVSPFKEIHDRAFQQTLH